LPAPLSIILNIKVQEEEFSDVASIAATLILRFWRVRPATALAATAVFRLPASVKLFQSIRWRVIVSFEWFQVSIKCRLCGPKLPELYSTIVSVAADKGPSAELLQGLNRSDPDDGSVSIHV
jgi:hypothetical protein